MNILNVLIRLRDDLKEWVAYNIIELKSSIPTKMSELENDIDINIDDIAIPTKISELENDMDYIAGTELTLGLHSDGMIYIFKNGKPIGVGIKIEGMTPSESKNLMLSGELYLNQRYSSSGGGLVTDSKSSGMFALIIPLHEATPNHTLKFSNLRLGVNSSLNNTLFLLDADKSNPISVNGHNNFSKMTEGVTESDGGTTATVTFKVTNSTYKYAVISLVVDTVAISEDSVAEYVICLE